MVYAVHMEEQADRASGEVEHVDVTGNRAVREFLQGLARIGKTVHIMVHNSVVAQLLPPGVQTSTLSKDEKATMLDRGRQLVRKARQRNKGVPARKIEQEVRKAVRHVRKQRQR